MGFFLYYSYRQYVNKTDLFKKNFFYKMKCIFVFRFDLIKKEKRKVDLKLKKQTS